MSAPRVLVLLLTALAGCQPIAPGPARYSCSRELPVESQCAAGWRCGLDGFCFDPAGATPVTLSCKEPATDCPMGWRCSLEGACFDPERPTSASLPCEDPLAHCPSGWKCGLDRRCLAPDVGGPWRCEDTARDCTGGWTCGALGLCFDRADAGRIACRASVPADCADGWRCGIDGLCQQLDAGAPWPCRDDSHCEAAWRCSPDGTCLDPSVDALRPNDGMPSGALLDLGWGAALPDDVVLDEDLQRSGCTASGPAIARVGIARFGPRVELFAASARGGPGLASACDAGVPVGPGRQLLRGTIELANDRAQGVAQFKSLSAVLSDAGISFFRLAGEGQVASLGLFPGAFKRLKSNRNPRDLLAISDRQVWSLLPNESGSSIPLAAGAPLNQLSMESVDGGTALIFDALELNVDGEAIAIAATDQGLFARSLAATSSADPWTHIAWATPQVRFKELRMLPNDPETGFPTLLTVVEGQTATPGAAQARLWRFALQLEDQGSPPVLTSLVAPHVVSRRAITAAAARYVLRVANTQVDCPVAIRGWVHARSGQSQLSVLQCELADGGMQLRRFGYTPLPSVGDIVPADEDAPFTRTARWTSNNESSVVMVDSRGTLSVASGEAASVLLQPWTPRRAPDAITGHLERFVLARTSQRELKLGQPSALAVASAAHFATSSDAGFVRVDEALSQGSDTYRLVAGVEQRPELSVLELKSAQDVAAVLVQEDDGGLIGQRRTMPLTAFARAPLSTTPQVSSVAAGGDGGLWYVSVGDQLQVTELGASFSVNTATLSTSTDLLPLPRTRLALTPLPGAVITHVLGLPADPAVGASHGQALVVAGGHLLHVRAQNAVVWRATEPLDVSAEVLESWADGARVRIGDRDGRVLSFPSRVALSLPLGAGVTAWDYVDVCGVTYALSSAGLHRLAAQAGVAIGTWTSVPLPASFDSSTGGRLYGDGTALLAFDARGAVVNVTGLTCAQPL